MHTIQAQARPTSPNRESDSPGGSALGPHTSDGTAASHCCGCSYRGKCCASRGQCCSSDPKAKCSSPCSSPHRIGQVCLQMCLLMMSMIAPSQPELRHAFVKSANMLRGV